MASAYSRVGSLAAALLLVFVTVPACSKSSEPSPSEASSSESEPSASSSKPSTAGGKTDAAPTGKAPPTTAEDAGDTVVFEVTGTGTALTIDIVPTDGERYYNIPLPWSTTVSITPDVAQLQVVVVGSGDASPGCKITLNGEVVAEKPDGGDAHCVFDR